MNTPSTVTNASARLTMESVNRLIEMEVNAATARLRGELETAKQRIETQRHNMEQYRLQFGRRLNRDGQIMVVIGIGCGIVGVFAGYFIKAVLMT